MMDMLSMFVCIISSISVRFPSYSNVRTSFVSETPTDLPICLQGNGIFPLLVCHLKTQSQTLSHCQIHAYHRTHLPPHQTKTDLRKMWPDCREYYDMSSLCPDGPMVWVVSTRHQLSVRSLDMLDVLKHLPFCFQRIVTFLLVLHPKTH